MINSALPLGFEAKNFEAKTCYGTYRKVLKHGEAWQIELHGTKRTVIRQDGGGPATLLSNWTAASCLDLDGHGFILLLRTDDGVSAGWVLTPGLRFVCDLAWLNENVDLALNAAVRASANAFAKALRHNLTIDPPFGSETFVSIGGDLLKTYLTFASSSAQTFSIDTFEEPVLLTGLHGSKEVHPSDIGQTLEHNTRWIEDSAERGLVAIPSLIKRGAFVQRALLVDVDGNRGTYFCKDVGGEIEFYLIQGPGTTASLYFPNDNLFITKREPSPEYSSASLNKLNNALSHVAFGLSRIGVWALPDRTVGLGLMTYGIANFGHAIWDEFQALERFAQSAERSPVRPWLLASSDFTGMDLYSPVEALYPEFDGRIIRETGYWNVFARAIQCGIGVVMRDGQRATWTTRNRIQKLIGRSTERQGWHTQLAEVRSVVGLDAPLITFGIRLSNRRPSDFLGLYVRLARYLRQTIGPFILVLDGINGSSDPGQAAASIFNGRMSSSLEFNTIYRDGSEALNEERRWANEFISSFENSDIHIINCVGMPIIQNLFWMQQSSFFVAPMGGGLAKLRWALNVPGYILISRTNIERCLLLHAYDSSEHMEPPFAPLTFNTADEVQDLPLDPPRTDPAPAHGIPHPEDFIVDETAVFPSILAAINRARTTYPSQARA